MPRVIDYPTVVARMSAQDFVSLYPNSGAFGLPAGGPAHAVGWVTGDDSTLRPAARALAIPVVPPSTAALADLAAVAWDELFPGVPAWVTPKAHWAYELDFGSAAWMPDLLRGAGVDPDVLAPRHDGSAVAFEPHERAAFVAVVDGLLANLLGSDFQLSFPGHAVACTIHHHKQLWWTAADERVAARLREMGRAADH